jgi:microcystin-dependent protein
MPLARLNNLLKNLNGNTLYVDPNELDASDSIENRGNSRLRPFKTIQRAIIEAARFSYVVGSNNDLFDQTTILISPGTHFIDNRPGYYINESNIIKDVNNVTRNISEFNVSSNFDINDPGNQLYVFNSHTGGVIVPKGTSIVANDLRKTKIRPKFVPSPTREDIDPTALFKLTGACYIYGFTVLDGDPIGKVYYDHTNTTAVPNYSHHKLTVFEYADDTNNIFVNDVDTNKTDLDNYYYKLSLAYGQQSGRSIIDGFSNFQPNVDENRIVGELGTGIIVITDIESGDGILGSNVITVTTSTPHNLTPFTPVIISGVGVAQGPTTELEYNGNFVVAQVVNETQFTYLLSTTPTESLNPSISGATLKVISDTVSSSSPYIFNCSLKSVYGMNGLHADGSKVSGFKSIVTAQYTGISLQKDDRAFVEYDDGSGSYKYQENFGVNKFLHQSSSARYRPSWESFHIKASNNSFIQCVSVFAIGYAKQFVCETGGDQSITNSNSNFGAISLYSSGFKDNTLAKDNHAFITHIIPPKEISNLENSIRFFNIDGVATSNLSESNQNTRVYIADFSDELDVPSSSQRSFGFGGMENDLLYYRRVNEEYSIPIEPSYQVEANILSVDPELNVITLSSISGLSTGFSGKIISYDGNCPDGISLDTLYYIRLEGGPNIKLFDNFTNAESNTFEIDIKNSVGLTTSNLKFVGKVSEKNSGDVGHPIQWDSTNKKWYIGVNSTSESSTEFFQNLALVSAPSAFVKRRIDNRSSNDKIYRVRYVIPKESLNASPPTPGFVLEKSSTSLSSLIGQSNNIQLTSDIGDELSLVRNTGIIVDAVYNSGTETATIVTSNPHNLFEGNLVYILNLKSDNDLDGVGTSNSFNGEFIVSSVIDDLTFTYKIPSNFDPGNILEGSSSFESWLSDRNCNQSSNFRVPPYTIYDTSRDNLPYFVCKQINKDYQIYKVDEIQKYSQGSTDGIYHLTLLAFKNSPSIAPFNDNTYKFSQPIENIYPTQNFDTPIADPEPSISLASRKLIGKVSVNDKQKNTSKESMISFFNDFGIGSKITGITTYFNPSSQVGICTVTTDTYHQIGGIKKVTLSFSGSGFVNGSYYDIPLCGGTGKSATINVEVASNVVSTVSISNPGSGYSKGDNLTIKGIPGSTTYATVSIPFTNGLLYDPNDTDVLQIFGAKNSQNNGVFILQSVTPNTLTYYNNNGVAEPTIQDGLVFLSGVGYQLRSTPDGSVYDSLTDTTTLTVNSSSPHTFLVGNKVIFDDPTIGISTVSIVTNNTTFLVKGNASSAQRVFSVGLTVNSKDTNNQNENVSTRQFSPYGGYKGKISQTITSTLENFSVSTIEGLNKGDFIQVESEIMLITRVTTSEIFVKRGVFGTKALSHVINIGIKKIKPIPVELRRNSIIRASGHTFEYTGFGPGNYSTGMPTNQDRVLNSEEVLISQSLNSSGGVVVYTGMNSNGEFFIGRTKFNAVTGDQVDVLADITDTGQGTSFDSLTVNKLTVNDTVDATTASVLANKLVVQTDVEASGIATFRNTTNSSSIDTGSIVVQGGAGVLLDVNVGGTINSDDGGIINDVSVGITSATTVTTTAGNLVLNSNLGTTIIDDNAIVTGTTTFIGRVGSGSSIVSSGDIVATAPAQVKGYGAIPIGAIVMWSGIAIPDGWSLCDGNNGTPDLRERFVVGAGGDNPNVTGTGYSVGAQGGLVEVTLSANQLPPHTHTASTTISPSTVVSSVTTTTNGPYVSGTQGSNLVSSVTTVTSGTQGSTTIQNNTPSGSPHENRPPYFALAFIMRTS